MKNKKLFAILTLVCFMFTLMPVAAFAAFDTQVSYIYVDEAAVDVNEEVKLTADLNETTGTLYIWFEEAENVPSTGLTGVVSVNGAARTVAATNGVVTLTGLTGTDIEFEVKFNRQGSYEVHAAIANPLDAANGTTKAEMVAAIADYELRTQSGYDKVGVSTESETDKYVLKLGAGLTAVKGSKWAGFIGDNGIAEMTAAGTNGATVNDVTLTVYKDWAYAGDGSVNGYNTTTIYAKDIEIETTSGVTVSDIEVKRSGVVTFDLVANKVGTHRVYITIGDFEATIKVNATTTVADEIAVEDLSKTPINIDNVKAARGDLGNYLTFKIVDKNGTAFKGYTNIALDRNSGMYGALNSNNNDQYRNHVALIEKPADSKLKSEDFALVEVANGEWTINNAGLNEEGKYTFKVVLDNGEYATASITVKEAADPVALSIVYNTDSVQLGAKIAPKAITWLDASYVATTLFTDKVLQYGWTPLASDIEMAVTGVAVESFDDETGIITVKDNEKYVGEKITVTVIDKEHNFVATKVLTVVAEANEVKFDTTAVAVDANTTITANLVDENGNAVGLQNVTTKEAYVIVLEKPAKAEASVESVTGVANDGEFTFVFSADTAGVYKVQAVVKAEINNVVRYYTGVQEIAVGATGTEDVIVMSIGSKELVVNSEIKEMLCEAVIKDGRTFVPFRAGLEALGATVDYVDGQVIAEMNGVKVVMEAGKTAYTVNGVAKTADVAPYLNVEASTTMVPARFVADAFGINYDYTTNPDGTVADVIFAN